MSGCGRVWWKGNETQPYMSSSGRPHLSAHRRTIRGPMADSPQYISTADFISAESLVEKSNEQRTVRLLPADRPLYQISDSPEFCQLSQF